MNEIKLFEEVFVRLIIYIMSVVTYFNPCKFLPPAPFLCRVWSQPYTLWVQRFLWPMLVSVLTSPRVSTFLPVCPHRIRTTCGCRCMHVTQGCSGGVLGLRHWAGKQSALSWAARICWVVEKLCRVWSGQLGNWRDQGNAMVYWTVNNVEQIPSSSSFHNSLS